MFSRFIIEGGFLGKDQSIMAHVYLNYINNVDKEFFNCVSIPSNYQKDKWFYLIDYLK